MSWSHDQALLQGERLCKEGKSHWSTWKPTKHVQLFLGGNVKMPPQKCSKWRASWERYQGRRSFFSSWTDGFGFILEFKCLKLFLSTLLRTWDAPPLTVDTSEKLKVPQTWKMSGHPYFWGAKTKTREWVFCPTHNPSNTEFPLHMFRLYWWSRWGTSKCLGNLGKPFQPGPGSLSDY